MDYYEKGLLKHIENVTELREKAIAQKEAVSRRYYEGQILAFEMALEDYRTHLVALEASIEGDDQIRHDWENGQLC